MILGVVLHAGLAYAIPAQEVWLATDRQGSIVIDVGIWFIHLFRMSLFFLLSGYFAALMVRRKGVKQFLWNRTVRVAIPMLLFFPFLAGAMLLVIITALSLDYEKRGLMGLIVSTIEAGGASGASGSGGAEGTDQSTLGWMHLWFLYYLMLFSLLAALCAGWSLRWDWLFRRRWLLALSPLILAPGAAMGGIPLPAAESFVPLLWPFAFYGFFYWAGWQLYGRESALVRLQPYVWQLAIISLILFVPYYYYLPMLDIEVAKRRATSLPPLALCIESVLTAYLSVLLTTVALLLGQRTMSGHQPTMRFIADSSYWVYLVHLPVVLLLQTWLVPLSWNVWIKFGLVTGGSLIVCLATYIVFVRYTPVGWLLNGKRPFP